MRLFETRQSVARRRRFIDGHMITRKATAAGFNPAKVQPISSVSSSAMPDGGDGPWAVAATDCFLAEKTVDWRLTSQGMNLPFPQTPCSVRGAFKIYALCL